MAEIVEFYKELGPSVFPEASLLERSRRDAILLWKREILGREFVKKAITSILGDLRHARCQLLPLHSCR